MAVLTKLAGKIQSAEKTNFKIYQSISGRLNGKLAEVTSNLVTGKFTKWAFIGKLKRNNGIEDLMEYEIKDEPLNTANEYFGEKNPLKNNVISNDTLESLIKIKDNITPYKTLGDYYEAYRSKKTSPTDVCIRIIELTQNSSIKSLNAIIEMHEDKIMQAATESTQRFENNNPLSVIDGIPFFVKEQIDIKDYHIYFGTTNGLDRECIVTATVVERLVDAGAILIGTANMSFAGLNVIGFNPSKKHGSVLNPYNTDYYCGGTSNGSAALVSCGLVPFTIATDSIGSIRVPSGLTGVVGIRATTYRISCANSEYKNSSMITIAPITSCVRDSAIIYGIIAGPDKIQAPTLYQPSVILPTFNDDHTVLANKIKIGYDSSLVEISDDKSIVTAIKSTITHLKEIGFTIVDYCIPEYQEIVAATKVILMKDASDKLYNKFKKKSSNAKFDCTNASIIYHLGRSITNNEYEQALKQRRRCQLIAKEMFSKFDIFISPMTGRLAQKIVKGDELCGVLDDTNTTMLSVYSAFSTLSGTPSLTVHVDTSDDNLPVGVQIQASWWNEALLYELAHIIEKFIPDNKKNPTVFSTPI